MDKKELARAITEECVKHKICTDNGTCVFYSRGKCLGRISRDD